MSAPKGKGRGNKLCAENCTAAHLLTAALEKVLQQEKIITTKSTYSSATKAGMTITYNGEITADLLSEITDEVNNMIASDVAIKTYKEPREKALEYHHSSRPIPDALTECAVFEVEGAVKLCCEETHLPSAAGVKKFAVLKSKRKKPRNKDDGSVVNGSYEFLFVIAEAADKVLAKKAGNGKKKNTVTKTKTAPVKKKSAPVSVKKAMYTPSQQMCHDVVAAVFQELSAGTMKDLDVKSADNAAAKLLKKNLLNKFEPMFTGLINDAYTKGFVSRQ